MSPEEVFNIHNKAMLYAQDALVQRVSGNEDAYRQLNQMAFSIELNAAMSLVAADREPMRSLLFKSAAAMALNAQMFRDAEKMIGYGLAGNPPDSIAEEMRNLFEDIKFHRSIEEAGKSLSRNSLRLSIDGTGVGLGWVESGEFIRRFQALTNMVYRSAQRMLNIATMGRQVPEDILNKYAPYLGAATAGSFKIDIRFMKTDPDQTALFDEMEPSVFLDVVENLDLINTGQNVTLREKMGDNEFYLNFVQLSKVVAPDGDRIKSVVVTTQGVGAEKTVYMRKPKSDYPRFKKQSESAGIRKGKELVAVGKLKIADAEANRIKVIDVKDGSESTYFINVDAGLVDIVKLYFDTRVRAYLRSTGRNQYELLDMESAEY